MTEFFLNLETVQNLDIKTGRMVGIAQEPIYRTIAKAYELDLPQCFLWLDVVRLLSYVMEHYNFEDVSISLEDLGITVKEIWPPRKDKFPFLTEFLTISGLVNDARKLGTTIKEITEDIQWVYEDIQTDLKQIFPGQEQISRLVDSH